MLVASPLPARDMAAGTPFCSQHGSSHMVMVHRQTTFSEHELIFEATQGGRFAAFPLRDLLMGHSLLHVACL